ncbi:helix-turn-helix domain-containing protein [Bifidobacterium sp. AGR2158]|uniref:helix-turn-helix domain-containing protein n=1 Tax=Bifidobacterium sp. AGR2158 TaxID=1280675 RepID=UPI0012DD41AD|nr:helix-turn-helix transcriptional regulator [Bifidobacterium sp. AGR2158]
MSKNASTRDSRFAQLIGLELKAEFARKEISQGDVADKLGHSRSGYSRWLNAKPSMPLEAFLNTCELIGADPRAIMDAAYERLTKEMGQPEDLSSAAVDAADAALADADNGIDIDAWADRIKAEDSVCEEE